MSFTSQYAIKALLNIQLIVLLVSSTLAAADIFIKPGDTLTLNESIKVPADSAWVYIQNGKTMKYSEVDQYYAHCRMEMKRPADIVRTIQADHFIIERIDTDTEAVMTKPVVVASLWFYPSSDISSIIYITNFYLKSSQQPKVELMSCQHWEDPTGFSDYLSATQIISTLGKLITISGRNQAGTSGD